MQVKPFVLMILDGWGYREDAAANAIKQAHTPFWDTAWQQFPHQLIQGSGTAVGLPNLQMGNSEVGHMNIGAGRIVYQDLTRIDQSIQDHTFFSMPELTQVYQAVARSQNHLHLMGLFSDGGVHSHESHFHALLDGAKQQGVKQVFLHLFLDGRDTPPKSARDFISKLEQHCQTLGIGKITSIIGRYYAMDRDQRWDRIEKAYQLIYQAQAPFHAQNAFDALDLAYARGETDEFVQATLIHADNTTPHRINTEDYFIFVNHRADRARELTRAFIDPQFSFFKNQAISASHFISMTQYDETFANPVLFKPIVLNDLLTDCLSQAGLKQLRLAETEKYAHVTFFFNGGRETPSEGEDRCLIPSPKVATYDLQPEMSALALTEKLVQAIQTQFYDVIIVNYANADMVGHTGNMDATCKAIETLDTCLKKVADALLAVGGEALITADHGNAEKMFDDLTKQAHTAHTNELVPLLYLGHRVKTLKENGILADIAPTMLALLNLPIPKAMTGKILAEMK